MNLHDSAFSKFDISREFKQYRAGDCEYVCDNMLPANELKLVGELLLGRLKYVLHFRQLDRQLMHSRARLIGNVTV